MNKSGKKIYTIAQHTHLHRMKGNMDTVATCVLKKPASALTFEQLREENTLLRAQMHDFLMQAKNNQSIMSRLQKLDLEFISTGNFRELLQKIFGSLAENSNLEIVTLSLIDPKNSLRNILQDLKIDLNEFPHLLFAANEQDLLAPAYIQRKPILGSYSRKMHEHFFVSCQDKPASIAILPLIRQNKLIGCLNLGSYNPERFAMGMGTDFIEQQASVIAICLENVINSERLTYIALTDPLTNVSNRRNVERRMLEEITRARRQRYSIACMFLDIDFFKKVNDKYGHQSGDDVLKEVASRIKAELRLSDTLGRFGGEEFVVLLVNTTHADALQVAERIRMSIAKKPISLSKTGSCKSTISIGVTTLTEENNQGDINDIARELLARSDQALYKAKEKGRNRVCQGTEYSPLKTLPRLI